jgi:hypothetical protein
MNFATAFLKYLAKTHFDPRYQTFDLFLEMPKGLKVRKHVTNRIVTQEDVENVLYAIKLSFENGEIDGDYYFNYQSLVLFGTFSGQRPLATTARLTVGQFRQQSAKRNRLLTFYRNRTKSECNTTVLFIRRWLSSFATFRWPAK